MTGQRKYTFNWLKIIQKGYCISPKKYFCYVIVYIVVVLPQVFAEDFTVLKPPPWQPYPFMNLETYPQSPELSDINAYYLLDMNSGYVLLSSGARTSFILASLTKLMTTYIILNDVASGKYSLKDRFVLEDESILNVLPPDASLMGLRAGDNPSIEELLYGLLVMSGNDAGLFLASISKGSIENFVFTMNNTARQQLGLLQTSFADPTGLSVENISTVEDIAQLAYGLLTLEKIDITTYTRTEFFTWNGYTKKNTNLLVGAYQGIDGMKTGYIGASGFNLLATASRPVLGNKQRRLLAIVIGVSAETIEDGTKKRALYAARLLDYGYDSFDMVEITYPNQEVNVWGGKQATVHLVANHEVILMPKSWLSSLTTSTHIPEFIWAPIEEGQNIGTVDVLYAPSVPISSNIGSNNVSITSLDLLSQDDIKKTNIIKRGYHRLKVWRIQKTQTNEE